VKVKSSHRRRGFVRWPRLCIYCTFRRGSVLQRSEIHITSTDARRLILWGSWGGVY
jgi:hypothetical protein